MEHVIIRKLEHLTGSAASPRLAFAVEARDRRGPANKAGAFQGDLVHVQLHGGLFVARAVIKIGWIGEYVGIDEVRARTRGSPLHDVEAFWSGRSRVGYAVVAELTQERWLPAPFWAGPRTYGYEWVVLDDDAKKRSWLDTKEPPRGGQDLRAAFEAWRARRA